LACVTDLAKPSINRHGDASSLNRDSQEWLFNAASSRCNKTPCRRRREGTSREFWVLLLMPYTHRGPPL
jgi:hypothetical protein